MGVNQFISTICLLVLCCSCQLSPDKETKDSDDRVYRPTTTLSPLFDSISPPLQTFIIKGDQDTIIVGSNGTVLDIRRNTFINSKGQVPKTVQIQLVEILSVADMIKSNLQTVSGEKILQTGGMFFLNAKDKEESLTIAENKSIFIELKSNIYNPQMLLFRGTFKQDHTIDWNLTGVLTNYLIPIPLSLLNLSECGLECSLSKSQIDSLLNPKNENTFIATREFEERICAMSIATCDWYNGLASKMLHIYLSNIEKPLFYSDSIIVDYLAQNYKNKIDSSKPFKFTDTGWTTYLYESFAQLKNQHLGAPVPFDKIGISDTSSLDDLVKKGYTTTDAEMYVRLYRIRTREIALRNTKDRTTNLATYSFETNKLGWVNVDVFLNEKYTENSSLLVDIKSPEGLDFVSVSLIIPRFRVAISSIDQRGSLYSFTKNKDGYRKLPVGEEAVVVAFSYQGNQPYFAKQKIQIPKEGKINLTIKPSTEKAIKTEIEEISN